MKITNNLNLPASIFNAVNNPSYKKDPDNFSCTEILKPVRIALLSKRHDAEIEEDCSDRIWMLLGSAVHAVLERGSDKNSLMEETLKAKIGTHTLVGTPDLLDADGNLSDYKITSCWSTVYGSRVKEWEEQINIYIYLYAHNGFKVNKANIIAIYRDWSAMKALNSENYPKSNIDVLPVKIWSIEEQEKFINDKLNILLINKNVKDDELPECSKIDTWEKETVYAVMKKGRKSSVRNCDKKEDAETLVKEGKGDEVVTRAGERTRCENYCSVKNFCSQYNKYKEE